MIPLVFYVNADGAGHAVTTLSWISIIWSLTKTVVDGMTSAL